MRPASRDSLPASTAARIELAIITGSRAFDTAVLTSTAAQPSSMASVASEAVPMPASSTTGAGERHRPARSDAGCKCRGPNRSASPSASPPQRRHRRACGRVAGIRCSKAARQNPSPPMCASRATSFLDVGVKQFAVTDRFELDPIGIQRFARQLGGQHGVLRGLATRRVGQEANTAGQQNRSGFRRRRRG